MQTPRSFRAALGRRPVSWPALAVATLLAIACASSTQKVTGKGTSETTVTASKRIRFKATGPMTFPLDYPGIGGMTLEPGVTIDVDLPAGGSVKLKDRVTIDGKNIIIGRAEQAGSLALAGPEGFRLTLQVLPGSTYTWSVPELFGDASAVVAVTGSWTAEGPFKALADDGAGGFTLQPKLLTSITYHVSGGAAVFKAPMETPYGRIDGTGTIASSTGMTYGFTGDLTAVSGHGSEGYVDPAGRRYDYGYAGAFPVRLDAGDGTALGTTTVAGGFDVKDTNEPAPSPTALPATPKPLR